ncbi:HAD family hydrolase [Thiohalobacter sp. IOR34]|uniref:HAD family hydrolase n=1 Tax=Thiohalobacter sp. IOR34 TaxID=3057176 RepID=UPI0025AF2F0B|nr:HAD family hydrolase [Thiohalobacter sp. IOR34]WJW74296.1 HAD family hydrolase [Thiohalobacter sp. IOR34]
MGSDAIDTANTTNGRPGLHIALISVHGLIRSHDLELGRDADTGGQTLYVVELARALARHPEVARVDLLTRRIEDPELSADYARPIEPLAEGARIVRIDAGPGGYIPKEALWDHLDEFADNALEFLRAEARIPDIIHSHYADGGYVGTRLAGLLGLPLVHTGHSLGRVKRRRLLASGLSSDDIEARYNLARRIEAEEDTLAVAERVITSTYQEIEEQYELYDHYQPERMRVIPPGTNLQRFTAPRGDETDSPIAAELRRFLRDPAKPMILALSRPDPRKNLATLVAAFGESERLRAMANLVIVAGNRDDIEDMEEGAQEVLKGLLLAIDHYDLYGQIALPKHHEWGDVPVLYRLAAASGGVFVNPALTEPFGLTLIEAAASGLPVLATEDGGPIDILANCRNGRLIDPLDGEAMAEALIEMLSDRAAWQQMAANGLQGVRAHYSWEAHAQRYLDMVKPMIQRTEVPALRPTLRRAKVYHDRAIVSDLDQNLLGDPVALKLLLDVLRENRKCAAFGIATGRRLDSALKVMKQYGIPLPDVLITSGGTEIYYAPKLTTDTAWPRHIDYQWTPHVVRRALAGLPGLELQPRTEQSRFKVSYYIDPSEAPSMEELSSLLHQQGVAANVLLSFGQFLDILPVRASKGFALRHVLDRWGIPLERTLVAGGSGADEDMMRGNTLAVVVGNRHHEELSQLADIERIYFSRQAYAAGILEALDHYDFFDSCMLPQAAAAEPA